VGTLRRLLSSKQIEYKQLVRKTAYNGGTCLCPSLPPRAALRGLPVWCLWCARVVCCSLVAGVVLLPMMAATAGQAQTYHVFHTFAGGSDGAGLFGNLIRDRAGEQLIWQGAWRFKKEAPVKVERYD
jgi:hypothetical protein